MEPLRIPVHYDFASSICYVAHRVMERMAGELEALGIELAWTPLDLARLTGWPRSAAIEGRRRENALRVAADLGVTLRMPTAWMDSRAAHAVALALAGSDREPGWRERVWCAVYEEGLRLDEPGALERLARDMGLDPDPLRDPQSLAALDESTRRARESNVTGVPTFMLGEWPFGGIQEEATMRSLLGRFAARTREDLRGGERRYIGWGIAGLTVRRNASERGRPE
jgi:2-hydroxychromene-2-carboxylate isomerase